MVTRPAERAGRSCKGRGRAVPWIREASRRCVVSGWANAKPGSTSGVPAGSTAGWPKTAHRSCGRTGMGIEPGRLTAGADGLLARSTPPHARQKTRVNGIHPFPSELLPTQTQRCQLALGEQPTSMMPRPIQEHGSTHRGKCLVLR
jgi:hypothetical protein